MTEEAKEKNHSLHNYVGTGTIRERYATTVDYLMYSSIFPIPNTNSALMWLPPQQCLRASTTKWICNFTVRVAHRNNFRGNLVKYQSDSNKLLLFIGDDLPIFSKLKAFTKCKYI